MDSHSKPDMATSLQDLALGRCPPWRWPNVGTMAQWDELLALHREGLAQTQRMAREIVGMRADMAARGQSTT